MSTEEYLGHLADYRREPWDSRAVVATIAQFIALYYNSHRGKDGAPVRPEDFMPGEGEPVEVVVPSAANFRNFI